MRKGKMDQEALRYHSEGRPGKIAVVPTKPYHTQHDLSLAYSPGVAAPCREIEANPEEVYRYTNKGNLVAVISNGTAVLGLGNIGALAGKPVMEGKSMLFKTYADIDAFDIEVDETDPEAFIRTVKAIAPTFGGINLEDIKAPECFEIDRRLSEELDIPVMHDDQHGTAVISTAAMLNAVKIAGKTLDKLRVVVNGAGAAAIACARLFIAVGVRRENMVFCDSRGVVTTYRTDINEIKREFATTRRITTLAEALHGADLFLGVSTADVLTPEMLRTMSTDPIVMALANPDPEIAYDKAVVSRPDIIFATGRSDYPNQVNNVLGFPYIFRGALDVRATKINEAMKLAAAHALAGLAQEPVPTMVLRAYALEKLEFGRDYLIPKPFDPRLLCTVAPAVARAAIESGVARQPLADGLRSLVVLLLEAVGSRDAAALRVEHRQLHRRDHLQQFDRVVRPPELLHVAGGMVGHLHLGRILAEAQLRLARFQQPVDIAGRQLHAIAHVRRIDAQQVGILVAQREGAGRRGAQHGKTSLHDRLADRSDIDLRLPFGLIYQSVGDQRHAAALLLFQQLHADAQRVHHPHEILAQRRVVVVDVAAVEIAHLFGESRLRLALLAHPPLERAESVFGEGTAMIDAHDLIHDHLHGFEPHRGVDDRRQRRRERSHQIGVGEHELAQLSISVCKD